MVTDNTRVPRSERLPVVLPRLVEEQYSWNRMEFQRVMQFKELLPNCERLIWWRKMMEGRKKGPREFNGHEF